MENFTNISFGPLPESSSGCKPFRLYFHQNGIEKNWDLIKGEDSVTVILYNKTSNKLVLIKKFCPRNLVANKFMNESHSLMF